MNGLPYYKRYPRDMFEGTAGMPLDLKGPYGLILDMIYLQNGRLPDDARYISGLLGCSVRAWNSIRSKLIEMGKISIDGGIISNFRADKELVISRSFQDKQRENGTRSRKNKDLPEAVGLKKTSHTDTDIYTEANASDAEASEVSFREEVWVRGVRFLVARGTGERQARSVIGKWLKENPEDAVFNAFVEANKERPVEPVAWITARLSKPSLQNDLEAAFAAVGERMATQ